MKFAKALMITASVALMTGCGGDQGTTYSLMASGQSFQQVQDTKIDVLWIIDNSGSMLSSQQNLANNFPAFIQSFTAKNYDFQIAVGTTQAYLASPVFTPYYNTNPRPSYFDGRPQEEIAWFRNGIAGDPSGFEILTPTTPNLHQVFMKNIMQGVDGRGDERSLQSMRFVLESDHNQGLRRAGSFLAVVLVTDEDDFSHDGTQQYERYDRPLHPVEDYVTFLDEYTGSTGAGRRYSVNTISVNTQACLDSIYNGAQKIGVRVGQLADLTGGVKGNLCGNFANELEDIARSIAELSTQFYLTGNPVPSSIRVFVNGAEIPSQGWTYNEAANSIVFQGSYVPPQNAYVNVTFDPKELTF